MLVLSRFLRVMEKMLCREWRQERPPRECEDARLCEAVVEAVEDVRAVLPRPSTNRT